MNRTIAVDLTLAVLLSSALCAMSPSTRAEEIDEDDEFPVPVGSVFKVKVNRLDQALMVHGKEASKPVLLVLHGGPGYAMMPLMHKVNPQLESQFVVVNWDQRGAGLTRETNKAKLTLRTFVEDAHQLTGWLKKTFETDKIYILGHSFGTVLGIMLAKKYPADYHAFIGVGQTVNCFENEQYMYDWALSEAKRRKDTGARDLLAAIGRPGRDGEYPREVPDSAADDFADPSEVTMHYVGHYGGDLYGKTGTDGVDDLVLEDGPYDAEAWQAAWRFSQTLFKDPAVWRFDFKDPSQGFTNLAVPVYFFMGDHDYDTPVALFEKYFKAIKSRKTWVRFGKSAHFPFVEEPARFRTELLKVKAETYEP
jgi:pimeloyl-ACP methyl ester carboxylesterase